MLDKHTLDLIDMAFSPFDWDKKFYKFNREEKDMNPYSTYTTEDGMIMVHNVLGINKEDLKLSTKTENHITYIVIEGKTKDAVTGKEYSINSRFGINESRLDMNSTKCTVKNGLLYIEIKFKKEKAKERILAIN